MNKLVEARLIPWFSFVLGLAICTSTAVISISYTAIATLVLFRSNFASNFKLAIRNRYVIGGLLFYLAFLMAALWTSAPFHDTSKMLLRIIGYLLLPLFFMAFSINDSARMLLKGFLIGALLSCVLSIVSFVTQQHILYGIHDNTWVVFHGHILHNAFLSIAASFFLWGILAPVIPVQAGIHAPKETSFLSYNNSDKKIRIWLLVIYLLLFVDVMFIVNGRTGQLMLLAMSAFIFIYRFKFKGALILVGAAIIIGPLLYLSPMVQKGIRDYQADNRKYENGNSLTSVGLRYEFHQKSIELIKHSPLLGYGTGSFKLTYQHYTNFTGLRATVNPHCDWLWIGVETGMVGIMLYLLFLLFTALGLNKLSSYYRCMGYTLLLGYLLAGLQNSFFIDNVTGMAFVVIMAAIMVAGDKSDLTK